MDKNIINNEVTRISRLLRIVQEIRTNPKQPIQKLWEELQISKSQFYKDKASLEQSGFSFEYSKLYGFKILEDRLTPITDLSLSDRLFLMFALENLCSVTDGHLCAMAVEVGKKLAGGLDSPFKEQLERCFDNQVIENGYGVQPSILSILREAISNAERIKILYQRSQDWSTGWREIEPRRIYLREKVLYTYARTVDEIPPKWKVFRLNRIKNVQRMGISSTWKVCNDDEFEKRQGNAFLSFIGDTPKKVSVRFINEAVPYILERKWHKSQEIIHEAGNSIIWTVLVAVPEEVLRWIKQFGDNAQLLSVED